MITKVRRQRGHIQVIDEDLQLQRHLIRQVEAEVLVDGCHASGTAAGADGREGAARSDPRSSDGSRAGRRYIPRASPRSTRAPTQ